MKKKLICASLSLVVSFFAGCQKDEAVDNPMNVTANDPVVKMITDLGFAQSDIQDKGDFYLVDDIAFSKNTPKSSTPNKHKPGARLDQWRVGNTVGYSAQPMISIKIDPSIPTAWRADIATAVNDWNSISDSRVNIYITNGSYVDITVRAEPLSMGLYGYGEYPRGDGRSGTYVVLNLNDSPEYRRRTTIVHEIGHCLGFVHTNEGSSANAYLIPGTPTRDAKSIMNSGSAPNRQQSWEANGGFSPYDQSALSTLYSEDYGGDYVYDHNFYSYVSPDVTNAFGGDPVQIKNHWLNTGIEEGRPASPLFDVEYYRTAHPDFVAIGMTRSHARRHWLNNGIIEGRASSRVFDVQYYLANNPDLVAAFGSTGYLKAYQHWLYTGIDEGRIASPNFNVKAYIERYPDIKQAFGNNYRAAMYHWYGYGRNEGRQGT